ncbi:MAG TPA: GAF domain-containing protein [Longimicrobium sp.]|nr:GAF domain-containing protein [Longimicrobium sp.]
MDDSTLTPGALPVPALFGVTDGEAVLPHEAEVLRAAFEALLETSDAGIAVLDRGLRYVAINEPLARINGAPVQAHLGRTVREVIPEWADVVEPMLAGVLGGAAITGLEISGTGDGRTYLVSYHPVRAGGGVGGVLGLVADVTESRQAARALREQEAVFSLLMENVFGTYFYVVDAERMRVRYASPAFTTLFGLPVSRVEEDPAAFVEAVHPGDRARVEAALPERARSGGTLEYRVALPDGAVRHLRDRAFPVRDGSGALRWIAGLVEDLTEELEGRARLERAVERISRLQRVTAGLSGALTQKQVADVLLHEGLPAVGAFGGSLAVLSADGETIELLGTEGYAAEVLRGWMRIPASAPVPIADAIRAGVPVVVADTEELARRYPRFTATRPAASRTVALACVPVRAEGAVLGSFNLSFDAPRVLDDEELGFLRALAQQCGIALERVRLYEAEQRARAAADDERRRSAFLAEASRLLTESLDPEETLRSLARAAVPELADWCGVDVVADPESGGWPPELRRILVQPPGGADAAAEALLARGREPRWDAPSGLPHVLRTGQAVFVPEVTQAMLEAGAEDAEHREILLAVGITSYLCVPLLSRDRVLGALTLATTRSGRRFTEADLRTAEALARRATTAVQNARLFAAEQAARDAAEHGAERARALQRLAAALSQAASPEQVADVVVEEGGRALGGAAGSLAALDAERGEWTTLASTGYPPEVLRQYARYPLVAGRPLSDAALSRRPTFFHTPDEVEAVYPAAAEVMRDAGHTSLAALPLMAGDRVVAGLTFSFHSPRSFDESERTFLHTVADLAAQALERSRLFAAERQARAEAESASRAKTEFLAVMSHELRTPLNAIGGYTELMEMGLRGPLTPEQAEDLKRIRRSQHHLLGLINDVLNFARLEGGHVEFDIARVPLGGVLAGLEALVAPQVRERGLEYGYAAPDADLAAWADAEKVRQIVLNLLSNAIKFTPRGGSVRLECVRREGRVLVRVSDTGAGVPPDRLESIFEPFVQLGRSLTSVQEGTGLGLSISRDLARGMGGDLAVESPPGSGAVFTLALPAAD